MYIIDTKFYCGQFVWFMYHNKITEGLIVKLEIVGEIPCQPCMSNIEEFNTTKDHFTKHFKKYSDAMSIGNIPRILSRKRDGIVRYGYSHTILLVDTSHYDSSVRKPPRRIKVSGGIYASREELIRDLTK